MFFQHETGPWLRRLMGKSRVPASTCILLDILNDRRMLGENALSSIVNIIGSRKQKHVHEYEARTVAIW